MSAPLVSINTPTFNRLHLLDETIESVLRQTYSHWELIIVDDGSSEPIEEHVKRYKDSRIKFHAFSHSGNYGTVRNRGLASSQGEFIAFLDSDDTWRPEKLSRLVDFFTVNSISQFILHNVEFTGRSRAKTDFVERHNVSLFDDLIQEKNIVFYPSALVFRKNVLNSLLSLDEQMPTGADHDFILRMASEFPGAFLNERLTTIRKHEGNTSSRGLVDIYSDSISHIRKFYEAGRLTKTVFTQLTAAYYYKLAAILLKQGDKRATNYFGQSLKVRPFQPKAWWRYVQSSLL